MKCLRKFKFLEEWSKIHISLKALAITHQKKRKKKKALAITSKRIYSFGTFTMQNFILLNKGSLQY